MQQRGRRDLAAQREEDPSLSGRAAPPKRPRHAVTRSRAAVRSSWGGRHVVWFVDCGSGGWYWIVLLVAGCVSLDYRVV